MRKFILIAPVLIFAVLAGCRNSTPISEEPPAIPSINLQAAVNSSIGKDLREMLENAEEFSVLTWNEKENKPEFWEKFYVKSFPVWGNKLTVISDIEARKKLLSAIYEDTATENNYAQAACFEPHHTIKAKYQGKFIVAALCFHCGKFIGSVSDKKFGDSMNIKNQANESRFSGSLASLKDSKSLPIFEELTEAR